MRVLAAWMRVADARGCGRVCAAALVTCGRRFVRAGAAGQGQLGEWTHKARFVSLPIFANLQVGALRGRFEPTHKTRFVSLSLGRGAPGGGCGPSDARSAWRACARPVAFWWCRDRRVCGCHQDRYSISRECARRVRATYCSEPGQDRKVAAIRSLGRAPVPTEHTVYDAPNRASGKGCCCKKRLRTRPIASPGTRWRRQR